MGQEVTTYQWVMLAIAIGGFVFTGGGIIVAITKAFSKLSLDMAQNATDERDETTKQFAELTAKFQADQKTQDHNVGETIMALRRYIETVEKEMHQIEIWGRDNYALKDDVKESVGALRDDIKSLGADIKTDMRNLARQLEARG